MKAKVLEIFLIAIIVLMLGGILASVKGEDSSTTTEIIEDFDKNSDFTCWKISFLCSFAIVPCGLYSGKVFCATR